MLAGTASGLTGGQATLTLADGEATGFALSLNPSSVAEDAGATTVTVTATMNGAPLSSATAVTVSVHSDSTATSGTDYEAVSAFTVTVGANQGSGTGTFTFTPKTDTLPEGDETLVLAGTASGLTGGQATLTLNDGEATGFALSLDPSTAWPRTPGPPPSR